MKLAITGASGFVGGAIVELAVKRGYEVRALVRNDVHFFPQQVEAIETGNLLENRIPSAALAGCDALVNCAARAHVMRETASDPEETYRAANSELPVQLLNAAADSGVRRFVQLSSVAAVTSRTPPGVTVDDSFEPAPRSPYGRSKLQADLLLRQCGRERGISVISLRPPSVFGPGVGAYFRMLMRCAKFGIPLPIGRIENRRSFVFLSNLADAVLTAAATPHEGAFIVTDSQSVSTAELYRALLRLYGRPVIVPPVPAPILRSLGRLVLGDRIESLIGDAAYDGSRFVRTFSWSPPTDFASALALTVGHT
jgi:nucleoside-diphosphate-sugar epimerase